MPKTLYIKGEGPKKPPPKKKLKKKVPKTLRIKEAPKAAPKKKMPAKKKVPKTLKIKEAPKKVESNAAFIKRIDMDQKHIDEFNESFHQGNMFDMMAGAGYEKKMKTKTNSAILKEIKNSTGRGLKLKYPMNRYEVGSVLKKALAKGVPVETLDKIAAKYFHALEDEANSPTHETSSHASGQPHGNY